MNLEVFLLAEYAQVKSGRFNIIGGGITEIALSRYPGNMPPMSVAIRLKIDSRDVQRGYTIAIELQSPSGLGVMPPAKLDIVAPEDELASRDQITADFVYRLPSVVLPEPGEYVVRLRHGAGSGEIGSLQFTAATQPSLNLVSTEVGDMRVQAGFAAFKAGEIETAEALFRQVLQEDEANPIAHNNLGFVLMCQGNYSGALQEFTRARELGYSETPVWTVNLGCCLYGLGAYKDAVEVFEQGLAMASPAFAVLCAISDSNMRAVSVDSASNYVALTSLNLAWSAAKLNSLKVARKHADVAARLLMQVEDVDKDYFDASLSRLHAFIKELAAAS